MGEQSRRLAVVKSKSEAGDEVVIELGTKRQARLAAAFYAKTGAIAVANAAAAQAKSLDQRYQELVQGVLDDDDVDSKGCSVNHEVDRGLLTVKRVDPAAAAETGDV